MADATGPISTLPGSKHSVPAGAACDDCTKPAVIRIQGETDSFGSEMMDFCQSCYDIWKANCANDSAKEGVCEWCKSHKTDLRPTRDYEEGIAGPVYYVCQECRIAANERAAADLKDYDYNDFDFEDLQ